MLTYELPKREIKFRCWYWEFDAMEYEPYNQWAETDINYELSTPWKRIYMQYTWLKDKSWKEIYEGDIVVLEVNWTIVYKTMVKYLRWYYTPFVAFPEYLCRDEKDTIVIGNIFENPELLDNQNIAGK